MLVADRMHRDVITIDREASLRRARRVMENHSIRHLPVVEGRRLVGILTDRDLRHAAPSSAGSLMPRERDEFMDYVRAGQVMTRRLITATPGTPMGDAARLLLRYRIGCLPVVEGRLLVGILTTSDLLEVLAQILGGEDEGDRVEVDGPDDPISLEALLRIAGAHRARMLSMVHLPPGGRIAMRAVLHIQGDPQLLCAALRAAGFLVAFHPAARDENALILEHLGRS